MSLLPLLLLAALATPQGEEPATVWDALAAGQTVQVEQVLFILNEELVTLSMVEERAYRIMRQPDGPQDVSAARSRALIDLIFDLIALEGFRRLGMDESLLEPQVSLHMERQIELYGSRARFEEYLRGLGHTVTSFRNTVKAELVRITWRGVVTGQQPSPLEGFRGLLTVPPFEIREAFDQHPELWEQGFQLAWQVLQFHDNASGPGLARAQAAAAALEAGTISLADAVAAAQSAQASRGDPAEKNLRTEILDFLLNAEVGAVSAVETIPNLGGLFFVVLERSPARTIGFEEAQTRIAVELRQRRGDTLVAGEAESLLRSSYTWFLPELEPLMVGFFGERPSPRETEF
ncbi:MAG: hypothetical protein O3A20_04290 [Planctomycetota bacterium]|nr:hypothetical protein [Planctomycetota bacterium]